MRLATLLIPGGRRTALWHEDRSSPCWVDLAMASANLLGRASCPETLEGLLREEGPGLATPRSLLGALAAEGVPRGVDVWRDDGARFAPPVSDPGAFLDFYAFEEHVKNARARRGLEVPPEWYEAPVYYRSNPRAFLGHGSEAWFPAGEAMMDYELELAAVLGQTIEDPTPAQARAAVAGYTLLNDWSARSLQRRAMAVGLGPNKGKDFATSLGPWLVTPDELGPLEELTLEARVNGEVWSRGRFGAIRWDWGELLASAGEGVRFEAGDVFGSGTLGGGCGLEQGRFLKAGDRVELDGGKALGVLAGTVRQREG